MRWLALTIVLVFAAGCGGGETARKRDRKPGGDRVLGRAGDGDSRGGTSAASGRCRDLLPLIRKAADEEGVDAALMVGLVRAESNFRNDARSPMGALGLTQCLRSTARAKKCGDLSDEQENLRCGARVLAAFLKHYGGNLYLGLSGYNAGHSMPNKARDAAELPANVQYVEDVLWGRARFRTRGCDF
ncbi:MAG: transglycosylase SLT domain-containing protein [Deltaproteobacteria bacterium]|nr:transglycosylase SLT domain-containing protein [Deltaproteobacteria bacterium]